MLPVELSDDLRIALTDLCVSGGDSLAGRLADALAAVPACFLGDAETRPGEPPASWHFGGALLRQAGRPLVLLGLEGCPEPRRAIAVLREAISDTSALVFHETRDGQHRVTASLDSDAALFVARRAGDGGRIGVLIEPQPAPSELYTLAADIAKEAGGGVLAAAPCWGFCHRVAADGREAGNAAWFGMGAGLDELGFVGRQFRCRSLGRPMAAGVVLGRTAAPAAPGSAQSVPARSVGGGGFTHLIAELTAGAEQAVPPPPALASLPPATTGAKAAATPLQGEHSATEPGQSALQTPVATGPAKAQPATGKPPQHGGAAEVPAAIPVPVPVPVPLPVPLPVASVPPPAALEAPAKPSPPANRHDARLPIPRAPTSAGRDEAPTTAPGSDHTTQEQPSTPATPPDQSTATAAMAVRPAPAQPRADDAGPTPTRSVGAVGDLCRPSLPSRYKSSSQPRSPVTPNHRSSLCRMPRRKLPASSAPIPKSPALPAQAAAEVTATVAARIGRAVQDGTHVLTMQLHPAELGRVEVRLSFHDSGVGVQMTLDRAETFDAFSRNRSAMEQHLANSGINLGTGGLDLRFGQQPDRSPQPFAPAVRIALLADAQPSIQPTSSLSTHDGLIDIFA